MGSLNPDVRYFRTVGAEAQFTYGAGSPRQPHSQGRAFLASLDSGEARSGTTGWRLLRENPTLHQGLAKRNY